MGGVCVCVGGAHLYKGLTSSEDQASPRTEGDTANITEVLVQ